MSAARLVGLDIGGTSIKGGAVTAAGEVLARGSRPFDPTAPATTVARELLGATLWRELRLATEPGGAAALAALASGAWHPADGERVGVLVCGANVDLRTLADTVDTAPSPA